MGGEGTGLSPVGPGQRTKGMLSEESAMFVVETQNPVKSTFHKHEHFIAFRAHHRGPHPRASRKPNLECPQAGVHLPCLPSRPTLLRSPSCSSSARQRSRPLHLPSSHRALGLRPSPTMASLHVTQPASAPPHTHTPIHPFTYCRDTHHSHTPHHTHHTLHRHHSHTSPPHHTHIHSSIHSPPTHTTYRIDTHTTHTISIIYIPVSTHHTHTSHTRTPLQLFTYTHLFTYHTYTSPPHHATHTSPHICVHPTYSHTHPTTHTHTHTGLGQLLVH